MSPKQKRRRARRARRILRRTVLKQTRATFAITTKLITPHMVHNEIIVPQRHPTWDKLLDHLSQQIVGLQVVNRRLELTRWIYGLAMRPEERQPALLLIGPECSGKTTFHMAMEMLLPNQSVLRYPPPSWKLNNDDWHDMLRIAWLLVVEGHPERFVSLFRHSKCRNGRFLKWLLTDDRPVDENLPNVQRFNVRLLATTIPRADLLRRLEDEREAFQRTLVRYKEVA